MTQPEKQFLSKSPLTNLAVAFILACALALSRAAAEAGGGSAGVDTGMMPDGGTDSGDQQMSGGGDQQMPDQGMTGGGSSPPTRSRMLNAADTLSPTLAADAIGKYLKATGVGARGRTRPTPNATAPTFSSTSQSSYSRQDGLTEDRWVFQAEYDSNGQLFFTRSRRTSTQHFLSRSNDSDVTSNRRDDLPSPGWKGVETEADYTGGLLYWDAFSDIENAQDADYLTLGYWLIVFRDSTTNQFSGTNLGVSGGGSDGFISANLAGLTGTASYEGPATGVVMSRENATAAPDILYFNAKASLTADFGDAAAFGSIFGRITEGMTQEGDALPEVTLGSATIRPNGSSAGNGGNYSGDTSGMTDAGVAFSGVWGGKFYGNGASATDHPGSVAGTFGAKTTDDLQAILGAFGAYKQ